MRYAVDLETSFAGKGSKRRDAWILQLGAASVEKSPRILDLLVRPLFSRPVATGEQLVEECIAAKQQVRNTMRFWSRILQRTLDAPRPRRERDYPDFIVTHMGKMTPLQEALDRLVEFTGPKPVWIAHNGKSFDFPILQGNAERVGLDFSRVEKQDSLAMARRVWPKPHKLGDLYAKYVSKEPFDAHLAAADAVALAKLVLAMPDAPARKAKTRRKAKTFDLLPGAVPGLGIMACRRLRVRGIRSLAQLYACANRPESWWRATVPHWKKVRDHISNR